MTGYKPRLYPSSNGGTIAKPVAGLLLLSSNLGWGAGCKMANQFESKDGRIIITRCYSYGEFHYEINVDHQQVTVDRDELLEIMKLCKMVSEMYDE